MTPDVNVILMDFPSSKGKEMVVTNDDGSYTILINAKLSHEVQMKSYKHAMEHIINGDFNKDDVQEIEALAHSISIPQNARRIPATGFEKRIRQLRRERKRIQQELEKREREISFLMECNSDPDWLFNAAEYNWLYEGLV